MKIRSRLGYRWTPFVMLAVLLADRSVYSFGPTAIQQRRLRWMEQHCTNPRTRHRHWPGRIAASQQANGRDRISAWQFYHSRTTLPTTTKTAPFRSTIQKHSRRWLLYAADRTSSERDSGSDDQTTADTPPTITTTSAISTGETKRGFNGPWWAQFWRSLSRRTVSTRENVATTTTTTTTTTTAHNSEASWNPPESRLLLHRLQKQKSRTQWSTLLRVGGPSLLAGLVAYLAFPAAALTLASGWSNPGTFAVLSQDASQFVQNFLTVAGLLFSILVGQTCT
jgi:hypothetical protein